MRATRGRPGERACKGLRPTQVADGQFLACQCVPFEDLAVTWPDEMAATSVTVRRIDRPAPDIMRIFFAPATPLGHRAGQFVWVEREGGPARAYSLASAPGDELGELHVEKLPGGNMSVYLHDSVKVGDTLTVRGPTGECCYLPGRPAEPLLLAGTGTGLAPLLGIARDALAGGHTGAIFLHHGAVTRAGLYAHDDLLALAARHPNFHYVPHVLRGDPAAGIPVGRIEPAVIAQARLLRTCRVFLCGAPDVVERLRQEVFLAGVSADDILADPFVTS